ncbi:DGQHR domain-containing protein [Vibrio sp. DW001]|uniref:DNA sulfur modification protein DndB n=1 Tax=Vibrio sp. DW001 TaxID=2912315 RepID=UPI0023B01C7A|nr:DNA sulfur modification protein DndB [Vibrio sp. DW001]WED25448.1 DGQHR domain-containing protein [Vibrio sp. DW001]
MTSKKLLMPCLRGCFGSWDTYTCLMPLIEIKKRVKFADELHNSKKLTQLIQRKLEEERGTEISEYLCNNKDRFFNSLVLGVYGGEPQWHDIGNITPNTVEAENFYIPNYTKESLGFMSIKDGLTMFAIDGQHRLSGIKKALDKTDDLNKEQLPVIIVAHHKSDEGIKRTRRLFTTLNKRARIVKKEDIIALDEDDLAACITREIVEKSNYFNEEKVSFKSGNLNDSSSITTLVNIFDCVQKIIAYKLNCNISEIDQQKIEVSQEKNITNFVHSFYELTFKFIPELTKTLDDISAVSAVLKYRKSKDTAGHLLYRPLGWEIYTDLILMRLDENRKELEGSIKEVSSKDLMLDGAICNEIVWVNGKMQTKSRITKPKLKDLYQLIFIQS